MIYGKWRRKRLSCNRGHSNCCRELEIETFSGPCNSSTRLHQHLCTVMNANEKYFTTLSLNGTSDRINMIAVFFLIYFWLCERQSFAAHVADVILHSKHSRSHSLTLFWHFLTLTCCWYIKASEISLLHLVWQVAAIYSNAAATHMEIIYFLCDTRRQICAKLIFREKEKKVQKLRNQSFVVFMDIWKSFFKVSLQLS